MAMATMQVEDLAIVAPVVDRFRAVTVKNVEELLKGYIDRSTGIKKLEFYRRLEDIKMAALIFPFRCSSYVMENLINWDADDLDSDPMYRLLFPTLAMLSEDHRQKLLDAQALQDPFMLEAVVKSIRDDLNPQPAGQLTLNKPKQEDLTGIQHKYVQTCLLFPKAGQTCHAYCTYCFRWAQFIGDEDIRLAQKDASGFYKYVSEKTDLTDVLVTGGDPLIMRVGLLRSYLGKFADPNFLPHIRNIRIGTRVLTFWPQRLTKDSDSSELLDFLRSLVREGGRSIDIMAHLGHDVELSTAQFQEAVQALQDTGAVIRSQAPLMKGINDDADVWARKWKREVQLGIIPYYMFLARDTGAQGYFSVPIARAHQIYADAIRQSSGLARTARGPSMSCTPGKVEVTGIEIVNGQRAFVLRFLQCRDPAWIGRVFFAKYSESAIWFDELEPLDGGSLLPWDDQGILRQGTPEEVLLTPA